MGWVKGDEVEGKVIFATWLVWCHRRRQITCVVVMCVKLALHSDASHAPVAAV